jgi:uncharacterized protein YhdP
MPMRAAELSATWTSGDPGDKGHGGRFPGRLELDGKLADGIAIRIARYLPLGLPEATRHYVESAVRGGTVKAATFRVRAICVTFPFHNARTGKDGEFRIAGQAENATFAFAPDAPQWPALTGVNGELVIDRSTLEIRNARAVLGAIEWGPVSGQIPNLGERPMVSLEATAKGPLADMVKVVNTTPIGGWISKSLATASATGPAELKLALDIPLAAVSTTTVKGSLALPGNDVRISADTPLLGAREGARRFHAEGLSRSSARRRACSAARPASTAARRATTACASAARAARPRRRCGARSELGLVARIAGSLNGQAAYRFTLGFVHGRPQVLVTSNLVGLGVDLPYPLAKPAAAPLELRYQTSAIEDAALPANFTRENLRVDLANLLQVQYVREQTARRRASCAAASACSHRRRHRRTACREPGAAAPRRRCMGDRIRQAVRRGGSGLALRPRPNRPRTRRGLRCHYCVRRRRRRRADDYVPMPSRCAPGGAVGSRRITGVVAGATEEAGLWRANITADQLEGYCRIPAVAPPRGRPGPGPDRDASTRGCRA